MFHSILSSPDMRVASLASGSSGNAVLVQAGDTNLLIDAGLSARNLAAMLSKRHVPDGRLDAILLTHEHSDHSIGAGPMARRTGARLFANSQTLAAYAERDDLPFAAAELRTGGTTAVGAIGIRSFPVPHDAADPVGYVLDCGQTRIAYFTDAGCVTPTIREALRGVHLAIVEANHDLEWLRRGPYTADMKARVASATGHLCNADCAGLLAERLEEEGAMSIWLAHLSRVNNSPSLARRSIKETLLQRTRVPFHLDIALRDQPSVSWRSGSQSVQLSLL